MVTGINKNIVVWFSCGAASAVAAKLTIEQYGGTHNVVVVNNPIANEHHDNKRFLKDIETWIGQKIVLAINKKYPSCDITQVFEDRKYMSGINGATCTTQLKKGARYQYELEHDIDYHVLGFTVEEWKRQKRFNEGERGNTIPILINELMTKQDCFDLLAKEGIDIPEIYKLDFPNANCLGCVKSTSPTYWNLVRVRFPKVFKERADQSRKLGVRLVRVKGKRIFLDELDPNAKGGKLKNYECGIFCDTQ